MVRRGSIILLSLVMASSQPGGSSSSRSATASEPAGEGYRSLRSRIAVEIERLGPHPWAGIYELRGSEFRPGTGPIVRLDLAPESGFVLERLVGCLLMPVVTDGIVIAEGGRLRLQRRSQEEPWLLEVTATEEDRDPLEGELLPLTLGGLRYLVPVPQRPTSATASTAIEAIFEAGWLMATPEPGWLLSTLPGDPLE